MEFLGARPSRDYGRVQTGGVDGAAPAAGRIFATGGLRFRLNSWFDIPQVGGPFDTGLNNRVPLDLAYRIRVGANLWSRHESEDTLSSLKALGVEYLVVHGKNSREYYRDFFQPERLAGLLTPAYRIEDDIIYSFPPRPLAHIMNRDELVNSQVRDHPEALARYVAALDDTARPPLAVVWQDSGAMIVTGPVAAGNVVSIQINSDPGWHATQGGNSVPIAKDRLGFMVIYPTPATQARIELRYFGTAEQRIMSVLSGMAWIAALAALRLRRGRIPATQ